jgi:hypothetical protein
MRMLHARAAWSRRLTVVYAMCQEQEDAIRITIQTKVDFHCIEKTATRDHACCCGS